MYLLLDEARRVKRMQYNNSQCQWMAALIDEAKQDLDRWGRVSCKSACYVFHSEKYGPVISMHDPPWTKGVCWNSALLFGCVHPLALSMSWALQRNNLPKNFAKCVFISFMEYFMWISEEYPGHFFSHIKVNEDWDCQAPKW